MRNAFALACIAGLLLGCASVPGPAGRITPLTPPALAAARVVGVGHAELTADGSALMLTEGEDSQGVVLLSERRYGPDVVMTFKIKPLQYEGVCVVILNASPEGRGRRLPIPDDYDGGIGIWRDEEPGIQNYFFAFHTAYHQPNAFVWRNPGAHDLAREPDIATGEDWRSIEIGHVKGRVWMMVDGEMVLDGRDPRPLPAGHIGFRLRGPGDGSFSALIKDVIIEELP